MSPPDIVHLCTRLHFLFVATLNGTVRVSTDGLVTSSRPVYDTGKFDLEVGLETSH